MAVKLVQAFNQTIGGDPGEILYTVPTTTPATTAQIIKALCTNDDSLVATAFNVKIGFDAGGVINFVEERIIPDGGNDLVPELADVVLIEGDVVLVYGDPSNRLAFYMAIREFS